MVQRGEHVICYNTDPFRAQIEKTSAQFCAYDLPDFSAEAFTLALAGGNLAKVTALILRKTEELLPCVLKSLRREQPDLVVFDSLALWAKIASQIMGIKAAATISHFILDENTLSPRDLVPLLWQMLPQLPENILLRKRLMRLSGKAFPHQNPLFPVRDQLNLVFTSRQLQPDTPLIDSRFHFVGPALNPALHSETFDFNWLNADPLVYISMGTVHPLQRTFFEVCCQIFDGQRAQFVFALGPYTDLSETGPIPPNFKLASAVPQLEILQMADLFISHGGLNSIHESLYYGVPLLMIPHQFEQLLNARCVAQKGAGLILPQYFTHHPITTSDLSTAFQKIFLNPTYRAAAGHLQADLRATGGPEVAANLLQAYLQK
ncbi:MAG: glycosyl transferase [Candidatus Sericytochromatia bacterium]|nr:glycosyl transferase [Candidatus Sericytochromatia bacterium]